MGRFLPAGRSRPPADGRILATVLFTDIVGSTELASRMGDRRWRNVLAAHHAMVRRELRRFGGREVDTAGDGFFATFAQPAQAVRCGAAIVQRVGELGIRLRAGVHAGEVEVAGGGVGGIAVHIGARVAAEAQPGEVLVSSTVHQLLAGSDLQFADRGQRQLKGVPGEWQLFALEGLEIPDTEGTGLAAVPIDQPMAKAARSVARTWVLVGAGAVVALLAIGAVLLAARPAEQALVAAPNTVTAFDPATDQIRQVIRVGSGPAALALAPDAIWVGNVGDRTVSRLDAASGREVARAGGVGVPGSLAAADGTVFVTDTFGGTLSTIDSRTNEVDRVVIIRGRDSVVAFGLVWLTDHVRGAVTLVNPRTLVVDGSIGLPAGSDPGAIIATHDAIWVADRAQAALHRIDPVTRARAGTVALCCRPTELAWALGSIWVTSADRDRVLRVDPTNGQVVRSIDVGDGPESIAGSDQGIWVAHPASGDIWRLDEQGERAAIIAVSGQPRALAAGLGSVWVAIGAP